MNNKYKVLDVGGALLDSCQLEEYLQKLASDQILSSNADRRTYPVPRVKENLKFISEVYNILNDDLKNKIPIHPAGEWILDNFYIIEKNAKVITRDLSLKKYISLIGIANGQNAGFARAYVLAREIVSYTDGKISSELIEKYLQAYQNKKTLSMEELWCIPSFLQIALIEKIRAICEKIYLSQLQKRKVDDIVCRFLDMKNTGEANFHRNYKLQIKDSSQSKYPFVEYMSYKLKKYGKKAYSYMEILEEQVNKTGTTVTECINREHFDIATKKISIGNSITSINALNRLNYVEIFNNINGVEEVLKNDPCGVYPLMDYKTKEYYRSTIEKIAKSTKISELYIAQKCLELAENKYSKNGKSDKSSHVGYYLVSDGKEELNSVLLNKKVKVLNSKKNPSLYVFVTSFVSIIISCLIGYHINTTTRNFGLALIIFIFSIIPVKNVVIKVWQYISGKIIKPKLIPKLDYYNGIPEDCTTMVIIPTIVKTPEKVKEIMGKLEIFYMANKSDNIYFTLLGDCSSEDVEKTDFDEQIVISGNEECKKLNDKYPCDLFPRFNFIYRKRTWSNSENCYLGWERKRGMITQFNNYLLGKEKNVFLANTFESVENKKIPSIKYVITLDSDTNLVLNTSFELVGAMSHILNKPIIDNVKNVVIDGYGLIQPRVGIGLEDSRKSMFTKIFSGLAGTDSYTNAISDFYQDNYEEGIFTGKGIYDLNVFSNVLKDEIPENTVLSHDLLEGCYTKCGLASDVVLMDGYPSSYSAFRSRLHRWIRGDFQILSWIRNSKLNILSKFKILDNIVRSLLEVCIIVILSINVIINSKILWVISAFSILIPYILDLLNKVVFKKNGEFTQKKFSREISGTKAAIIKGIIDVSLIPDKAFLTVSAGVKSLYRIIISKKHLLEWTTAEEAEKMSKDGILAYYKIMPVNAIFGTLFIVGGIYFKTFISLILGILFFISPIIMSYLSRAIVYNKKFDELSERDKDFVLEIGKKTWNFFKENINEKSNFLPPDNYQEDRKKKVVYRTSPTNIGLALLSVVASYDLGYESKEFTIDLIEKMLASIEKLPKWNGHLYNWYNIENLTTLSPRYVSSVDSGNFVGYLYVLKQFLIEQCDRSEQCKSLINIVERLIENTDFSTLFDNKNGLFSIGYNIEENKMTDSYYDLLASEARQTSFVAIAKKDISSKHWKNLSRALTILNKYKGLVSWSGTAFEYLMPTVNMKLYPGSLLDESCKFMIMSQKEYSKKLGITWGISEAAFNLKDFNGNYQYKAFGIPWLGLKRGLADEMVVSSYGTILAINEVPNDVIKNLRKLQEAGMYDKYGFYESIDYTPSRARNENNASVVKTYMAHHQGLIMLSIDNLVKNNILQNRFLKNPEISAVDILLQERMPDNVVITKEQKEKVEKIKYVDYDFYSERFFDKKSEPLNEYSLIANNDYSILIDNKGNGYSKFKNKVINRYKETDYFDEGIHFFIKNVNSKNIWSPTGLGFFDKSDKYHISFFPDKAKFSNIQGDIKSILNVFVTPEDPVEIRRLELKNIGEDTQFLEVSSCLEPVISSMEQDYAHKAFNNLFVSFESEDGIVIARRKFRSSNENDFFLAVALYEENFINSDFEFELDKKNFFGRQNFGVPDLVEYSKPFSNKLENTTNPIIAYRKAIQINSNENKNISLIISASENRLEAVNNVKKYMSENAIERAINLSRAHCEAKTQYLGITGASVNLYQRILSHCLNKNWKMGILLDADKIYKTSELWKYGISGDNLIITVFIKNIDETYIVKKLIEAFEYYKMQNMPVDLVIVDEEKESYENYVGDIINDYVVNHQYMSDGIGGKIFVLKKISKEDKNLLKVRSDLVLIGGNGKIELQLDEYDYEYKKMIKNISYQSKNKIEIINSNKERSGERINMEMLKIYNGYGGFSEDGKEYIINVNKSKKLPAVWSNILANEKFGTVTTEGMGGYTWYKNSRLNRITALSNDSVQDMPSEMIYFKDCESNDTWSISVSPMPDNDEYYVKYGFGYTKYIHTSNNIDQELEVFVPRYDSAKVGILHLKNLLPQKRKIKLIFYARLVLGEDEVKNNKFINLNYDYNGNVLIAKNIINDEFKNYVYISSTQKIGSFTGNKTEFFGKGNISNPDGIKIDKFSNSNIIGNNGIVAFNLEIELETLEHKDIAIVMGAEDSIVDCKNMAYKYAKIENCVNEYEICRKYWSNITNRILVNTQFPSLNIMMNGWLIYQTLVSRILGKTGFYQSGGAWGFRDQLQDSLCMKYVDTNFCKNQIIKHSMHQFIEGDVLHWWHEDTKRGVRTRFSDDMLWLAYVTCDYVFFTGDYSILDYETSYLEGKLLEDGIDEKYDVFYESDISESIYMHCIRAIKKTFSFGEHGFPKIGSGDWNDGFSNVGNKGKGESVWLGFFLYDVLNKFIRLCERKNDIENIDYFKSIIDNLRKHLNIEGWDGRWFKRAYCDDGSILGSIQNQECRIDSIAQSWSAISGAGDNDKKYIAMDSLEKHLVDTNNGIIKLLDPPFENGNLQPGYIKAYLPGTRENGGQYTHAAVWAIMAEAILGFKDKAVEFYKMINPIEHSKTKELAEKYKVEPYVIAADVYGARNLAGSGGWTWYTGSSSWYYVCFLKYILGIEIEEGILSIKPYTGNSLKNYEVKYKFGESIYNIKVKNDGQIKQKQIFLLNGNEIAEKKIKLVDDGSVNEVEIFYK